MSTLKEKAEQILQEKEEKILAENIKKDIQIFDVTGTLEEGIDTSDATATENDIVENTSAYVDGVKLDGTLMDSREQSTIPYVGSAYYGTDYGTTSTVSFKLPQNTPDMVISSENEFLGYINNANFADSIGLTADIIKKDEIILNISGTYEGIDTSDANATENDLIEGTSAYVNGVKIDGTIYDQRNESGFYSFDNIVVDDNTYTEHIEIEAEINLQPGYNNVVFDNDVKMGYDVPYSEISSAIGLDSNVIAQGHTVLGVEGTYEGTDTSDATALENDIVEGKTAYSADGLVEGTIRDFRTGMENAGADINSVSEDGTGKLIMQGAMNFEDIVTTDGTPIDIEVQESMIASAIGLTANKIKKNENVLGVIGTLETTGTDTSDANATANDLVENTTAYVDGVKLEGTITDDRNQSGYHELNYSYVSDYPDYNGVYIGGNIKSLPTTSSSVVFEKDASIDVLAPYSALVSELNITPGIIKKDEVILGVTGTYEGSGSATSINTTLNFQVGETSGSSDIEYMTYENFKQATFDLTQLYNWNRNNGNGTPISQTILEMPYVYLHIGYIHQSYELEAGIEVDYKFVTTSKPIVSRVDEYDSVTQMAKDCYYYEISNGFFTNVEYNPDTGEDYVPEEKNYTTFEEFWTDFCNTIYEETSYRCVKPKGISDYSISSYAEDGYLFSNV